MCMYFVIPKQYPCMLVIRVQFLNMKSYVSNTIVCFSLLGLVTSFLNRDLCHPLLTYFAITRQWKIPTFFFKTHIFKKVFQFAWLLGRKLRCDCATVLYASILLRMHSTNCNVGRRRHVSAVLLSKKKGWESIAGCGHTRVYEASPLQWCERYIS